MRSSHTRALAVLSLVWLILPGCSKSSGGSAAAPQLTVPASQSFGAAELGATETGVVQLYNASDQPQQISAITLKGAQAGDFLFSAPALPWQLQPGDSASISVSFNPSAAGVREASLCLEASAQGFATNVYAVALSGGGLPQVLAGPVLTLNPNGTTPLAALLELETDVPTTLSLLLDDGSQVRRLALPDSGTDHQQAVLGLHVATNYQIQIEVSTLDGIVRTLSPALSLTTAPLPAGFPQGQLLVSDPSRSEPGVVMFSLFSSFGPLILIVDQDGELVWYMEGPTASASDIRRRPNGNLLWLFRDSVVERDMLGGLVRQWVSQTAAQAFPGAIPVNVERFHHEVSEMPSGNLVTLAQEVRSITDYPTSETDPLAPRATMDVIGDVVVEFQPDGTIVTQWALLDLLDPRRIGYDATHATLADWSHGNAVIYDARDDSFILSLRQQDCLVKLDRSTGSIVWLLGNSDNWGPPWNTMLLPGAPGIRWPFHMHAPEITAAGNLALFDNGNHRASPFDPPLPPSASYSRAVIYDIDSTSGLVSELWTYGGPGDEIFYSFAFGDADEQPLTGNILVTDGAKPLGAPSRRAARIVEVTRTQPAEKVFELLYDDPVNLVDYGIYRAEKLPSLYP